MSPKDQIATVDHPIAPIPVQAKPAFKGTQRYALGQRPAIVWLTGLSGAGKTTIAQAVSGSLKIIGRHVVILDGDDLRTGLNQDLGFSPSDRRESMRRASETARLMAEAGLIVIVALISPYREGRLEARRVAGDISFLEVFIDTPHIVCEHRDPKGLYAKAREGKICNFTGISDSYEPPEAPEMTIKTRGWTVEQAAAPLVEKLAMLSRV